MRVYLWLRNFRRALWRAWEHDALGVAKGAAYSSVLSLFPTMLVMASIVATTSQADAFLREISRAVGAIFPPLTRKTAQAYFETTRRFPVGVLISMSLLTLWTASGVMMSWMEGFRHAYELPKVWGMVKERLVAFSLVIMAGLPLSFATVLVAFGTQIENWLIFRAGHDYEPYIFMLWTLLRWLLAILTSVAVMALIYHNAVPRTQPWHSVLPGAALATVLWFVATALFGTYVRRYAAYSLLYGPTATAIVLMVWLYIVSVVVLVGAEFNALLYPRVLVLKRPEPVPEPKAQAR